MSCQGWLTLLCGFALCLPLAGCQGSGSGRRPHLVLNVNSVSAAITDSLPRRLPRLSADKLSAPRDPASGVPVTYDEHAGSGTPGAEAAASSLVDQDPREDEPERLPDPPSPLNSAEVSSDEALPSTASQRGPLALQDVVVSVYETYPPLAAAVLERQIADGKQLSTWGAFDLGIKAYGIAMPEGFYENYRSRIALTQPTLNGGYLYSGYKIGDGLFQPWFGERETNEGGEFSAGFGVPLLKNRVIDERRRKLLMARFSRLGVEPMIRTQLLEFVRIASINYWTWVAAGQSLEAQRELLELAEARVDQIEERVKVGDLSRIADINNQQLIAARETKVIEAERKLQAAAIKLSLFVRDADGAPRLPDDSQLPENFPEDEPPDPDQLEADIIQAINARPELAELEWMAEKVRVELAQAENDLLPKLDTELLASKDVGAPASPKGDKTPFELEIGLYGEVPVQRRKARGRIESARGKLAQIDAKREFVVNKVTAFVQDAYSAMEAAAGRIDRAQKTEQLAKETLSLGREQFNVGDIDLVELNIYELSATDAQLAVIAAQADFFAAVADYRAALSLDPLQTSPDQVPQPPADPQEPFKVKLPELEADDASAEQP